MSRPSRFMSRSMTPSSSVKMSTSKFNLVCGRPREIACSPNVSRVPNPQPPKPVDARVTTPSMSRREFGRSTDSASVLRRERSMSREARAPVPPSRDSSFYLPFGSYADIASHTKPPTRYSSALRSGGYNADRSGSVVRSGGYSVDRSSRRSMTPLSFQLPPSGYSTGSGDSRLAGRRSSISLSQQTFTSTQTSRQRHSSCSFGTPASARGIPFY